MIKLRNILLEIEQSLSKMDEQYALNYINRVIIPLAVKKYNGLLRNRVKKNTVDIEEVKKHLKKTGHHRHVPHDKTTTDVITYESNFVSSKGFKLEHPFIFAIYRSLTEKSPLTVEWDVMGYKAFSTVGSNICESLTEEIVLELVEMSKAEEDYALYYVRRMVLPEFVQWWNLFRHPPLDWKDVKNNFKRSAKTDKFNKVFTYPLPIGGSFDIVINKWKERGLEINAYLYKGNNWGEKLSLTTAGSIKLEESESDEYEYEGNYDCGPDTSYYEYLILKKKTLSKLDEDIAFDFIKKLIVPIAVKSWNSKRYPISLQATVTPQEVIRHLKKTRQSQTLITYTCSIDWTKRIPSINGSPASINFYTEKDDSGNLFVRWRHSFSNLYDANKTYVSSKHFNSTPNHEEFSESLQEGESFGGKNSDDIGNHDNIITKEEESKALDFIRKVMIPVALTSYNEHKNNHFYQPITDQEIRKNLKKTYRDFPNPNKGQLGLSSQSIWDPSIQYTWQGPNGKWKFTILKSRKHNKLYISWAHPFNFSGKWEEVKYSSNIKENQENGDGSISKIEEDYAFQMIKRFLVPMAVKEINKNAVNSPVTRTLHLSTLTTEEDIIKNLKKTKHERNIIGHEIEYTSSKPGRRTVVFFIMKAPNEDGELKLAIGYRSILTGEKYGTLKYISTLERLTT